MRKTAILSAVTPQALMLPDFDGGVIVRHHRLHWIADSTE